MKILILKTKDEGLHDIYLQYLKSLNFTSVTRKDDTLVLNIEEQNPNIQKELSKIQQLTYSTLLQASAESSVESTIPTHDCFCFEAFVPRSRYCTYLNYSFVKNKITIEEQRLKVKKGE